LERRAGGPATLTALGERASNLRPGHRQRPLQVQGQCRSIDSSGNSGERVDSERPLPWIDVGAIDLFVSEDLTN
jgi:hypothetical protein